MKITQDLEKRVEAIETKLGINNFESEIFQFQGFEYKTIKSETGKVWLDRNLGASRVAESPDDFLSYGGHFLYNNILCPFGYRIPTEAEWNAERHSWSRNNAAGAFASPLKLPMAGLRKDGSGSLFGVGSYGHYWSSTVSGSSARYLLFDSGFAGMFSTGRAYGYAVRLIKNT